MAFGDDTGTLLLPRPQSYLCDDGSYWAFGTSTYRMYDCDDGSYWAFGTSTYRMMETNGSLAEFNKSLPTWAG
jgi:hypothetical protein